MHLDDVSAQRSDQRAIRTDLTRLLERFDVRCVPPAWPSSARLTRRHVLEWLEDANFDRLTRFVQVDAAREQILGDLLQAVLIDGGHGNLLGARDYAHGGCREGDVVW